MKTPTSLIALLAALAMPVALQAQAPDAPHHDGPPPSRHENPQAQGEHHWRGHEQHGPGAANEQHRDGGHQEHGPGFSPERAEHLKEAVRQLRLAGLGPIAEHIEQHIKEAQHGAPQAFNHRGGEGEHHHGAPWADAPEHGRGHHGWSHEGQSHQFGHGEHGHAAPWSHRGGEGEHHHGDFGHRGGEGEHHHGGFSHHGAPWADAPEHGRGHHGWSHEGQSHQFGHGEHGHAAPWSHRGGESEHHHGFGHKGGESEHHRGGFGEHSNGPGAPHASAGVPDELRSHIERLTHQVEELSKIVAGMAHARAQQPNGEFHRGEHPQGPQGQGREHHERGPQGDQPPGNRGRGEHRDAPPAPEAKPEQKGGQSSNEEIRPAIIPTSPKSELAQVTVE